MIKCHLIEQRREERRGEERRGEGGIGDKAEERRGLVFRGEERRERRGERGERGMVFSRCFYPKRHTDNLQRPGNEPETSTRQSSDANHHAPYIHTFPFLPCHH